MRQLQLNQTQLASNVDAISGRVNVLAGLKEVRDVAAAVDSQPVKKNQENINESPSPASDDAVIPPSPSVSVSQLAGDSSSGLASHARKASSGNPSKIILT